MIRLNYPKFWDQSNFLSKILYPFSLIYILCTHCRKTLCKTTRYQAKTICVGNATIGGTGKTPIVKFLAHYYSDLLNKKVVVISKGYGGNFIKPTIIDSHYTTDLCGDEAIEIADALKHSKDCTIIIAKKQSDCANLVERVKPDIIIFDDGMQNPTFHKDFTIMLVDGIRGFGNNMIFPSGPLREKPELAVSRANVVCAIAPTKKTTDELQILAQGKYIKIDIVNRYVADFAGQNLFLLAGIGNNDKFFNQFNNYNVVGTIGFQDHHPYTQEDIVKVNKIAAENNATIIVVTEKDYVKLKNLKSALPLRPYKIEFHKSGLEQLTRRINEELGF